MTAGFRWVFLVTTDGSPFNCHECDGPMRAARNCSNHLRLSEEARVVGEFTGAVSDEIRTKGATKVFSLRGLRFYECPLTAITAETFEMIRIVHLVEGSGSLYFSGGWAEQPHWLVEAYEIFRQERYEHLKGSEDGER